MRTRYFALASCVLISSWSSACGDDTPSTSDTTNASDADTDLTPDLETMDDIAEVDTRPEPPLTLEWGPCAEPLPQLECARLEVPFDYRDPAREGPTVTLHITRARATEPDNRIGVLFVNPGGPGTGSGGQVAAYATNFNQEYLARYFDIVGVDWRGTGESTPTIDCMDDDEVERLRAHTKDLGSEASIEQARELLTRCRAAVGDDFLSTVDVVTVARDHDRVRRALGEETVNYFGASYGTRLGAVYASLFPDRVRAFVLDSAVSPGGTLLATVSAQAEGFSLALDRFFAWCGANDDCKLSGGEGLMVVAEAWEALETAIEESSAETADGRELTNRDFFTAMTLSLSLGIAAAYAEALADLRDGDASALLELADLALGRRDDGSYDYDGDANFLIRCVDQLGEGRPALSEYLSSIETVAELWPLFEGTGRIYQVCYDWDIRTPRFTIDAKGAPRLLVVGSAKDPVTPFAQSEAMRGALNNDSFLMEFPHEGHVVMSRSTVGPNRIRDFLIDPSKLPDEWSCYETLAPLENANVDPIVATIKVVAQPPADGRDAVVEIVARDTNEVLARVDTKVGVQTTVPFASGGKALDVFVRASVEGYWTTEVHRLRRRADNFSAEASIITEAELLRLYGGAGFDASMGFMGVSGRTCDNMGIGESTFSVLPAQGKLYHVKTNPNTGSCSINANHQTTDTACNRALIFNLPAGTYVPGFESETGAIIEGPPVTMNPKTFATVLISK